MDTSQITRLSAFISAWAWQIISLKFLVGGVILFALPRTNITAIMFVAFFGLFIIGQFMANKRKKEVQGDE